MKEGDYYFLGKAKIIKREEIEIAKSDEIRYKKYGCGWEPGKYFITFPDRISTVTQLSKTEGFESVELMFKKLEEYAGSLKTPKKFYLYTFEWV